MSDFFAKNYIIGFFVSLRFLPPRPVAENREGILTRALMEAQTGKTIFFEEDILPGQCCDFCPVNMVAFENEIFGIVRVADLTSGLAVLKEEFKFCNVLAVSHIAWFDTSDSKWQTDHPKEETVPFEHRVRDLKSWPRPAPVSEYPHILTPRLLREFLDYLDAAPGEGL
jgi:hypothetical protein